MSPKVSDGAVPLLLAALCLCNLRLWPRSHCHGLEAARGKVHDMAGSKTTNTC